MLDLTKTAVALVTASGLGFTVTLGGSHYLGKQEHKIAPQTAAVVQQHKGDVSFRSRIQSLGNYKAVELDYTEAGAKAKIGSSAVRHEDERTYNPVEATQPGWEPPLLSPVSKSEQLIIAGVLTPSLGGGVQDVSGPVKAKPAIGKRSTFLVTATTCDTEVRGSAWAIKPNLLVTAAHVIAGSAEVLVTQDSKTHHATVVWADPTTDLALLHVENLHAKPLQISKRSTGTATLTGYPVGDGIESTKVTLRGYGLDPHLSRWAGMSNHYMQTLRFDGAALAGDAGAPLLDSQGRVVGTVIGGVFGVKPLNGRAIPNSVLAAALSGMDKGGVATGGCAA